MVFPQNRPTPLSPTQLLLVMAAVAPVNANVVQLLPEDTAADSMLGRLAVATALLLLSYGLRSIESFLKNVGILRDFTKEEARKIPRVADFV